MAKSAKVTDKEKDSISAKDNQDQAQSSDSDSKSIKALETKLDKASKMPQAVVAYSNDLNQISLGNLNEQEQNLLFTLLVRLKDKGHAPVVFTSVDLSNMVMKNYTTKELTSLVLSLKDHFFKLDFTQIIPQKDGGTVLKTINLFKTMEIKLTAKKEIDTLNLEVNEQFEYILNKLKSNFTKFQLANFLVLKGKYSKTLFRLLIQYRNVGKAYKRPENSIKFNWKLFKDLMGIPKSSIYTTARIEKQILAPAIEEISWKQFDILTNYNGVEFPYFCNLKYEKIKRDPTKKTSPVVEIEFTWDRNDLIMAKKNPGEERKKQLSEEFEKVKALGKEFIELWRLKHRNELLSLKMDKYLKDEPSAVDTPVDATVAPADETDAEVVTVEDTDTPF